MIVKFSPAAAQFLNRLGTLRAERQREFLQLDNIYRGFLEYQAAEHGADGGALSLLPDGSGIDVQAPPEAPKMPQGIAPPDASAPLLGHPGAKFWPVLEPARKEEKNP